MKHNTQQLEAQLPESVRLHVVHLRPTGKHPIPKRQMKGKKWITIAKIIDKETNVVLSEGKAYCSKRDVPSRRLGRRIAVGRAMTNLTENMDALELMKDLGLVEEFKGLFDEYNSEV